MFCNVKFQAFAKFLSRNIQTVTKNSGRVSRRAQHTGRYRQTVDSHKWQIVSTSSYSKNLLLRHLYFKGLHQIVKGSLKIALRSIYRWIHILHWRKHIRFSRIRMRTLENSMYIKNMYFVKNKYIYYVCVSRQTHFLSLSKVKFSDRFTL